MLRRLTLALVVAAFALLPRAARATGGFGIQGGLFTPTANAKNLLASEWQVGLRLLAPPVTPLCTLPIPNLNLDLGVDIGVGAAKKLSTNNLDTQVVNLTAVYRYTVPLGDSFLVYAGLGGRLTTLWGQIGKELRDGSLFGHLRGEMTFTGGADYALSPGMLVDVRLGYGIFGFTSWEAMAGLLFAM